MNNKIPDKKIYNFPKFSKDFNHFHHSLFTIPRRGAMLFNIIRKEILDNINSPKFVFTFLLCTILILLSVYTGINNYRAELREYNAAVALNKKNLENQPNYQALAGLGTKITRSPQVLGTIITGIQDAVGRQATVNIAYDPSLIFFTWADGVVPDKPFVEQTFHLAFHLGNFYFRYSENVCHSSRAFQSDSVSA